MHQVEGLPVGLAVLGLATVPACGVALGLGAGVPPPELAPAAQLHQVKGLPLGLAVPGLATAPACGVAVLGLGAGVPQPELAPAEQLHQVKGLPLGLVVRELPQGRPAAGAAAAWAGGWCSV